MKNRITKKVKKAKEDKKKEEICLKIKKEEGAVIPSFAYNDDAGLDICANQRVVLKPIHRMPISTGLYLEVPKGYVGLVWDKSGLALNSGIKTMAGVIDSSYRGELRIVLINLSRKSFVIEKGMKIAQLLIQKIEKPRIQETEDLENTSRSEKGFGSSGLFGKKSEENQKRKLPKEKKEFDDIRNALE